MYLRKGGAVGVFGCGVNYVFNDLPDYLRFEGWILETVGSAGARGNFLRLFDSAGNILDSEYGSGFAPGLYYNGVQIVNDAAPGVAGVYHYVQFEADIVNGLGYLWRDTVYKGVGAMNLLNVVAFQCMTNMNGGGNEECYFDDLAYYSTIAQALYKRQKRGFI